MGQRHQRAARQADFRGPAAAPRGHHRQDLGKPQVLPAQYVALPYRALVVGLHMALRHVVYVDHVQPGVDEGRHAPGRRLHHHAPGGGRLHVARPDGGGGIHRHHRQPLLPLQALHLLLRQELGALVDADHVVEGHRRLLVRRRAAGCLAQHRDGGGVDDALHPLPERLLHELARARHVGAVHGLRVAHPDPVVGGDVEQCRAALQGLRQRLAVREIAFGQFNAQPLQVAPVAARAHQTARPLAPRDQRPHDGRADKARASGHQCGHGRQLAPRRPTPQAA